MRSGSEAGSGCVRRSADATQSSFSSGTLGTVQHSNISAIPPAAVRPHPYLINGQRKGRGERKRLLDGGVMRGQQTIAWLFLQVWVHSHP